MRKPHMFWALLNHVFLIKAYPLYFYTAETHRSPKRFGKKRAANLNKKVILDIFKKFAAGLFIQVVTNKESCLEKYIT